MPIRVGTVPYLNAVALVAGLDRERDVELTRATPAVLAAGLEHGTLDVALVPVVEAARLKLWATPSLGIAARGAVRSVRLDARVPLNAIRSLALDPASRTSVALVRLLLARSYDLRPDLVSGPATGPVLADGAVGVDAALIIGDRALVHPPEPISRDLAAWWHDETQLPFVFAVWAGRDRATVEALAPVLTRAATRGRADLPALAGLEGPPRGIPVAMARSYLEDAIVTDLGREEHAGLDLFLEWLRKESLLPPDARLELAG